MAGRCSGVVLGAAILACPGMAAAQQWGGSTPREGACFYQDANYRGRYFCVDADDELSSMPGGANDRISSIRVFGRAEVTVYRDQRFHGDSRQFTRNIEDLQDEAFNDAISSVQVRGRGNGYGRYGNGNNGNGRGYGNGNGGYGYGRPVSSREAEQMVRRAYEDILDRQPDQEGMRVYRSRIVDDGWSEQQVRDELRRSPEFREKGRMTREKAEDMVRDAYLGVLKREPDPGSRVYVDRILRDGWKQQDVERELRKSPEYRERR